MCSVFDFGLERVEIPEMYFERDDKNISDLDTEIPILKIIGLLVRIYADATAKKTESVKTHLENLDKLLEKSLTVEEIEEYKISKKVIDHVVKSTKNKVQQKLNLTPEDSFSNAKISDLDAMNEFEKAMLNGLKACAFSLLREDALPYAISFISSAIRYNPDCAIWHFTLGTNLRRERRMINGFSNPTAQELQAFAKAFELSKNATFGIGLALCHRENKDQAKSAQMYRTVFAMKPDSCDVHLRLALGFLRLKCIKEAEACLNYVAERKPEDSMFLHYKGLFLQKANRLEEASNYFKLSAEYGNHVAAMNYIELEEKMNPGKNFVGYLREWAAKDELEVSRRQQFCLNIAFYMYFKYGNVRGSLREFEKAIDIDKESKVLENFSYNLTVWKSVQVFDFLKVEFLPRVYRICRDEDSLSIYGKLLDICNKQTLDEARRDGNDLRKNMSRLKMRE